MCSISTSEHLIAVFARPATTVPSMKYVSGDALYTKCQNCGRSFEGTRTLRSRSDPALTQ